MSTTLAKEPVDSQISSVVGAIVGAIRRVPAGGVGDAVDAPLRALTRKIVAEAVAHPRPVPDAASLTAQLAERPRSPLLGGASAAAMATKVARRFGPLRFLARRTPMWLVAAGVPALYASVSRGTEELSLVASHLVLRARAEGHEPDVERVRRAAVQLVAGGAPEAGGGEPPYGLLIRSWLRRAVRATLPFTKGVATADPGGVARAASRVPTSTLGP